MFRLTTFSSSGIIGGSVHSLDLYVRKNDPELCIATHAEFVGLMFGSNVTSKNWPIVYGCLVAAKP